MTKPVEVGSKWTRCDNDSIACSVLYSDESITVFSDGNTSWGLGTPNVYTFYKPVTETMYVWVNLSDRYDIYDDVQAMRYPTKSEARQPRVVGNEHQFVISYTPLTGEISIETA